VLAQIAERPRVVAGAVAALTAAVAVAAPAWTPAAGGVALLGAGFAVMAPCELQMAGVLAAVVGRSPGPQRGGVRSTALRFTAGYLLYYVPAAVVLGALAQFCGGAAWALAAAGGGLALVLGSGRAGRGRAGVAAALSRPAVPVAQRTRVLLPAVARGPGVRAVLHDLLWALCVRARRVRRRGAPRMAGDRARGRLRRPHGVPVPRAGAGGAGTIGRAWRSPRRRAPGAGPLRRLVARGRRRGKPGAYPI
jgi:hypothetical protein